MIEGLWLDDRELSAELPYLKWPEWLSYCHSWYSLHTCDQEDVLVLRCRHCRFCVLVHPQASLEQRGRILLALDYHTRGTHCM